MEPIKPSKAAMERVRQLCEATDDRPSDAFALYIDRVDRVAGDVFELLGGIDGAGQARADLMGLMLPDPEPDPLVEVFRDTFEGHPKIAEVGGYWDIEKRFREALTAAGYEIRKVEP